MPPRFKILFHVSTWQFSCPFTVTSTYSQNTCFRMSREPILLVKLTDKFRFKIVNGAISFDLANVSCRSLINLAAIVCQHISDPLQQNSCQPEPQSFIIMHNNCFDHSNDLQTNQIMAATTSSSSFKGTSLGRTNLVDRRIWSNFLPIFFLLPYLALTFVRRKMAWLGNN